MPYLPYGGHYLAAANSCGPGYLEGGVQRRGRVGSFTSSDGMPAGARCGSLRSVSSSRQTGNGYPTRCVLRDGGLEAVRAVPRRNFESERATWPRRAVSLG